MSFVIYLLVYDKIREILAAEKIAKQRKRNRRERLAKQDEQPLLREEVRNEWDHLFESKDKKGRK